jgi:hypothetical protein
MIRRNLAGLPTEVARQHFESFICIEKFIDEFAFSSTD